MKSAQTAFMATHIPELEQRFSLSFFRDDSCVEYFLDARGTGRHVSQNLILSRDNRAKGLYVAKFYPQLFLEQECKYLSAACFYLMVHHAAHLFHLRDLCTVWLETDTRVFEAFYAKLREFEFHIARARVGGKVCVKGQFHDLPLITGAVAELADPFAYL